MKRNLMVLLAASLLLPAVAEQKKPNIVFIFADDQTFESVGAYGLTDCKTPNLDRLVHEGATFSQAFNMGAWNGAVCLASRAMLNSGAFVNRAQKIIRSQPHWSEMMRDAGYKTYMTGKWHVPGKPRFDVVQDVRPGMPKGSGYNRPTSKEDYEKGWKPWDKSHGGYWAGGTHWSEVVANHGVDFLEQAKKDDKPFFMYLAFNAPHDPRQAPKEYVDMYPLDTIKVPKNYLEVYPYHKEIGCGPGLRDEKLAPFPRTEFAVKVHRQEYFACVTHMDAQIGRILEALEKTGKADNTYIIFTADHGLAVGHHGLIGKQNMYEHSMRVPFMIVGPGIKAGSQFEMPIYLQDAMATSLDLAGVEKPAHVEFNSLMPLIKGERKVQYDRIYGKYVNSQRMISMGGWKMIYYPKIKKFRLYNVKKDPDEMVDQADNPEYAGKLKELKKAFKELQKEMDDSLQID
ncbi:sulfatase-like hydrolase/transferase [Verrucomicrobiaceae bacterium N1E253]|uniref:Sulfatase-like hydrolase/transferase n=2 Tax=Oceaniferula marina TaxID=2748318 RepID=A0A851GM67_9BACT|nr:sulfatase-like hydrolase/transferase [Oceaniferula marina]